MSGNEQYFKNSMERVKHLWRCGENRSALMLLERLRSMIDVKIRVSPIFQASRKNERRNGVGRSDRFGASFLRGRRYHDGLSLAREALELVEKSKAAVDRFMSRKC